MYSLFLYDTAHLNNRYTQEQLTVWLKKIQLIDKQHQKGIPGNAFMSLITFLGCSPNHDIEPNITVHINPDRLAVGGDSINKIICPNCKHPINKPASLLKNNPNFTWDSPCCQQHISLEQINWRKSAGFSQTFIQISNIFPKEAIPSELLMQSLSQFSQTNWDYFYSKQYIFK